MRTREITEAIKTEKQQTNAAASVYLAAEQAKKVGVPTRRIALMALLGCGATTTKQDAE